MLLCSSFLIGCDSGGLLKTTKDKQEVPAGQVTETQSDEVDESDSKSEPVGFVIHITIDATAADRGLFADTTFELPEDATVYDALVATNLPFGGDGKYVKSINGLKELDYGKQSGWKYSVNGEVPMVACGKYKLSDGDDVRWYYVTSYSDM